MPDLVVEKIYKEYPTRGAPLAVLSGISLTLSQGEGLAVLGPSGCGKSTLLHILGTLERPTSGTVQLNGQDPFRLSEPALAEFRNARIGFIFQDHHLMPQCSVLENTLLPAIAGGSATNQQIARARDLLERVGLGPRLEHRPAELSGGERQRCAIARALLMKPTLLLADEPTGNLDRTTAAEVGRLLFDMQREERTILVIVTHSLELARGLDRRMELDAGQFKDVPGA